MAAMGIEADEAATAIRVSLGWNTTEHDIERFLSAWAEVHARARASNKDRTAA